VAVYKLWYSRLVSLSVQFLIHASSSICICLVWCICMMPDAFLMCVASASERVLAEPFWKKPRDLPRGVLAGYEPWCGPTAISSQLSRANLLSWSPAAKPTPDPVLKIKNIHCSRSLIPRLVWGSVNFDHAKGFLHVWSGGACIRWQGRRQHLAHHFYVHLYLRSARQTSLRLGGWF